MRAQMGSLLEGSKRRRRCRFCPSRVHLSYFCQKKRERNNLDSVKKSGQEMRGKNIWLSPLKASTTAMSGHQGCLQRVTLNLEWSFNRDAYGSIYSPRNGDKLLGKKCIEGETYSPQRRCIPWSWTRFLSDVKVAPVNKEPRVASNLVSCNSLQVRSRTNWTSANFKR